MQSDQSSLQSAGGKHECREEGPNRGDLFLSRHLHRCLVVLLGIWKLIWLVAFRSSKVLICWKDGDKVIQAKGLQKSVQLMREMVPAECWVKDSYTLKSWKHKNLLWKVRSWCCLKCYESVMVQTDPYGAEWDLLTTQRGRENVVDAWYWRLFLPIHFLQKWWTWTWLMLFPKGSALTILSMFLPSECSRLLLLVLPPFGEMAALITRIASIWAWFFWFLCVEISYRFPW